MISDIKRKTLPEIARVVGRENHQGLHHFLSESPWAASELSQQRLKAILQVLKGQEIIVIVDETGDKKKGHSTDYVKRQYIGNLGKIENGIVVVTVWGLIKGMTFPLIFEVYKPKERLKEEDEYKTKPQLAGMMLKHLKEMGFKFELVLADSLYGESDANFISVLNELFVHFAVAIRSNHGVWLPAGQGVRYNKWRKFERVFSDGKKELRYIREIIFGKKRSVQYWQITTDIDKLPENSTWWIMTKIPGVKYSQVGNVYGLRTWVEYGLKQGKNELGWADFRLTDYCQIQKWWEVVCSAYLMVSLHSSQLGKTSGAIEGIFAENLEWDEKLGWKNLLNNLRLILEPFVCYNRIKTWLKVFPIPQLERGLLQLISLMNVFGKRLYLPPWPGYFYFSSA
jgi:SRSO17 transposase